MAIKGVIVREYLALAVIGFRGVAFCFEPSSISDRTPEDLPEELLPLGRSSVEEHAVNARALRKSLALYPIQVQNP